MSTAQKPDRLVGSAENAHKNTASAPVNGAVCERTSETLPVSVPAGTIARVERGLFAKGVSANPGGKPAGERALLQRMYGRDGKKVFRRLEALRTDPKTPKRLQMQIDFFVIERLFGRAPLPVGVEGGPSLLSLLAEVTASHGARREGGAVTLQDVAIDRLVRWKTHPPSFVRENFGVEPDPWQLEVLAAFPTKQRLASCASKGVGKSTLDAWLGLNFLATRPHANVAVTSISGDNLKDGLWKEFAKWIQASPFLSAAFEWQKERIVSRTHPATWWVSARQWPRSADAAQQAETLAGLHSDFMMFLIDEAGAVPQAVAVTAEAALSTGIETKLVISGNPNSLEGPLYRACTADRHLWFIVKVSGDPDDPKRSPRVDIDWARQQIAQWGRDNAWVKCNVLGEFPSASLNSLLGPEDVLAAMRRRLARDAYEWSQKRIGVDVARFGDDRTVLAPRQGLQWFKPVTMRHARGSAVSTDIAARVMQGKARWGSELEVFDGTGGWSAGAVDVLRASGESPIDCQFHAPAIDPRFANRRAELWFTMAEAVKSGAALPNEPELVGELTTPTYTFVNGKFQLEAKDQVKQRLGRSPDLADAYALTFALPDMPARDAMSAVGMTGVGRCIVDYDPYAADQAAERRRARAAVR